MHPSSRQNYSDVNISKQEILPIGLALSFDNLGSKKTSIYQIRSFLSLLGLLGFDEITYYKNISKDEKQSVEDDTKGGRSNNSYYGVSILFEYFYLTLTKTKAVAGACRRFGFRCAFKESLTGSKYTL